jgi:hypothetical protein
MILDVFGKGPALVVVHDEVPGPVLFKEGPHVDDVRVVKPRQGASLLPKLLQAKRKLIGVFPFLDPKRALSLGPLHQMMGKVLLDRHDGIQMLVARPVGDAKTPEPEDRPNLILVPQTRSVWKRHRRTRGRTQISVRGQILSHDRDGDGGTDRKPGTGEGAAKSKPAPPCRRRRSCSAQ